MTQREYGARQPDTVIDTPLHKEGVAPLDRSPDSLVIRSLRELPS
jgi:hypothetical protein